MWLQLFIKWIFLSYPDREIKKVLRDIKDVVEVIFNVKNLCNFVYLDNIGFTSMIITRLIIYCYEHKDAGR